MISVIMANYKHQGYILDAVYSIINQTYRDWELFIANDDDSDLMWLEKLDKRIRVYQDGKHLGQGTRMNMMMEEAQGKWIALQDADDISLPYRLDYSLDYIERAKCRFIYGDHILLLPNGEQRYYKAPEYTYSLLKKQSIGGQGSWLFHKDLKGITWDNCFSKDWIWQATVAKFYITDIERCPFPMYKYRTFTSNFHKRGLMRYKRFQAKRQVKRILDTSYEEYFGYEDFTSIS